MLEPVRHMSVPRYTVKRSSRRTVSLEVDREGTVIVRAPKRLAERALRAFVEKNTTWIQKRLAHTQKQQAEMHALRFRDGGTVRFLGDALTVDVQPHKKHARAVRTDDTLVICARDETDARQQCERMYCTEAKRYVTDRVDTMRPNLVASPRALRITGARTRFGSCSTKGTVSIAWRIMMAPRPVVDYVIAHELAHLVHMNHSKRFWREVERLQPEHNIHRRWLRDHGHTLDM